MRHGKKFNKLGRTSAHRKALLKNLSIALIKNKRIFTTLAKAKALRPYVEPLITKSKTNTSHSQRVVFKYLQNKNAVKELFGPIATKVGNRPGGYTRILRTGHRKDDGADMAMIELVDYNEDITQQAKSDGRRSRSRTRRGGSGGGSKNTPNELTAQQEEE